MKHLFKLLALFVLLACSPKQEKKEVSDDEQIVAMLKEFYTQYIIESEKGIDIKKIEGIQTKYSTISFLKKINSEELEEDPYINGQDFNKDWIKTLSITKDQKSTKPFYKVCFVVTYDNSIHCINVSVKKENNEWKIDDVSW